MHLQLVSANKDIPPAKIGLLLSPCEFDLFKRSLSALIEDNIDTLHNFFSDFDMNLHKLEEEDEAIPTVQAATGLIMLSEAMMVKPEDFTVSSEEVEQLRDRVMAEKEKLGAFFRKMKREFNLAGADALEHVDVDMIEEAEIRSLVAWLRSENKDIDEHFKNADERVLNILAKITKN